MKLLFENWRKFLLTEKLMLKPGPNGWDLYGELVAQAYERAPKLDPQAVPAFEALGPFVNNMFNQMFTSRNYYIFYTIFCTPNHTFYCEYNTSF